jgi:hypothetical protein
MVDDILGEAEYAIFDMDGLLSTFHARFSKVSSKLISSVSSNHQPLIWY